MIFDGKRVAWYVRVELGIVIVQAAVLAAMGSSSLAMCKAQASILLVIHTAAFALVVVHLRPSSKNIMLLVARLVTLLAAAFVLHSVVNFSTKANALFDIFLFIGMMTSGCELLLNALLSFLLPFVRWVWNALHDTNNEQTPNDIEMALLARTAGVVPPPDLPLPA